MIGLLARLSRSLPLVIALIVLAIVIYMVVTYVHSKARAKEVLISVFTVLCAAISIFFGLASLYAVIDNNSSVLELAASFAVVGVLGLIITRICNHFFKKNNPHYSQKAQKATVESDSTSVTRSTIFWKIYDLLGNFRPKK
ncbi:guanylate cyclase [Adlercreutzia sp. ZJ304]|uniref:guanylate cyclase n=1 Tax=Adlercreutzia sp. ZJ304 TaxID=2709791 RepID=UPI0013EA89C7|nr:guanylate cyclase [Adlercreutzia sp. ZJ304]